MFSLIGLAPRDMAYKTNLLNLLLLYEYQADKAIAKFRKSSANEGQEAGLTRPPA